MYSWQRRAQFHNSHLCSKKVRKLARTAVPSRWKFFGPFLQASQGFSLYMLIFLSLSPPSLSGFLTFSLPLSSLRLMSYLTALLVQRNRKQERHTASWLISTLADSRRRQGAGETFLRKRGIDHSGVTIGCPTFAWLESFTR